MSTTQPRIEFLYFAGCPNAAQTRENLDAALHKLGLAIEPQYLEVQPESYDKPFSGSPSVLVNGTDVYSGTVPTDFSFACRTFEIDGERSGVLPTEFIQTRIHAMLKETQ